MKLTHLSLCAIAILLLIIPLKLGADQQTVPETDFVNISIQPPYNPTYHGRDPFLPLDWVHNQPQITISELEYHGVVEFEGSSMALFGWRSNQTVRYTLKNRKLYSDDDIEIDGVLGDINKTQVILRQGGQTIVYPR
jgi:hypothetical protein